MIKNYFMSEQNQEKNHEREELSDILLVLEKEKMKIQAVSGIEMDGTLKTIDPTRNNQNQFMRVDRSGDVFSNFFSNFFSQLKNPTRFSFFKVPANESEKKANEIQNHFDHPTPESTKLLESLEVKPENEIITNKSIDMETTSNEMNTNEYRYQPEQIDWETMANLGLSREKLEKLNVLEPLLKGFKTNELIPISLNLGTAITKMDARLSLQQNDQGEVVVALHGIRKEPQLNFPFFGHYFTQEDKNNLLSSGNMGRIVDLTHLKSGEKIPSIISIDRLTNELIALKAEYIKIPDEIKGVQLNEQQKETLREGKPLFIEGMISKKDKPFDAFVQFNADKRYVEFLFDRNAGKEQQKVAAQSVKYDHRSELPKMFRGKELDDAQYEKLKSGETVYISGLQDAKGKEYSGYITFNTEKAKIDFSFSNPSKLQDKIQPAEDHKKQTAVNSDGNTNESTKNTKEALESKQQMPKNEKQQNQQNAKAPVKSKGRKV